MANSLERDALKILKLCDVIDWESLQGYLRGIHKNAKGIILGQWILYQMKN
jgi:hypothetical protein